MNLLINVFRKRRAEAPLIATVILMAITLFCVSLTLSFVQQNLARRSGESEFALAKTFMKNIGLGIDDVAWHTGQMNTLQYSSQDAEIHLREGLIHYKIEVLRVGVGQTWNEVNETKDTYSSVLFYDIPQTKYSLDNTYFEEILPGNMTNLIQNATTAPITRVFALQRPPRVDENYYVSVGVLPLIRCVPFNITIGVGPTLTTSKYVKLYLANITQGDLTTANPRYITLTGGNVEASVIPNVRSIKVTVIFPKEAKRYNSAFFNFPETTQTLDFGPSGAEVELYLGTAKVGFLK